MARVPDRRRHRRRGRRRRRELRFVVSNSLSPDLRFASDTVLYSLWQERDARPPALPGRRVRRAGRPLPRLHRRRRTSIGARFARQRPRRRARRSADRGHRHRPRALPRRRARRRRSSGFRLSTRGFKELAGGLAPRPGAGDAGAHEAAGAGRRLARRRRSAAGRDPARRGRRTARRCGATRIAVAAFAGREAAIADMVDYSCALTERVLERALADDGLPDRRDAAPRLPRGPAADLPVPFNRVMVATFFLAGMDIAHRIIAWFDGHDARLGARDGGRSPAGRAARPPASPRTPTASPG